MSERVKPKNFIPNQRIVKQGDEGDDMFILKEGQGVNEPKQASACVNVEKKQ